MRVLVLGGTFEASQLADLLARQSGISSTLSFAGRTKALRPPQIPYRIGGFGGVDGLQAYLEAERTDVLVDATHPFAEQMSRHADRGRGGEYPAYCFVAPGVDCCSAIEGKDSRKLPSSTCTSTPAGRQSLAR